MSTPAAAMNASARSMSRAISSYCWWAVEAATKPWFQECTSRTSASPPWVNARTRFSVAAEVL